MKWLGVAVVAALAVGCSAGKSSGSLAGAGGSGTGSGSGTGTGSGSGSGAGSGSGSGTGGSLDVSAGSGSGGGAPECSQELAATIRDFSSAHPDFEKFAGSNPYPGLVKAQLGADGTPDYAAPGPTPQTSGPANFAQWYHDVQGVNQPFAITLPLKEVKPGVYSYASNAFFPIDNKGFGNEGNPHNFHFTTRVHTTFTYSGGEVFSFTGDDDLWLFINGKLALDLGGTHPSASGTVDLDAMAAKLGIAKGGVYPMDIFHAERHTDQSNFTVETTIACFQPIPK